MLNGKQRSYLRGKGNDLDPVVHIGKDGISSALVKQTEESLEAHELVKCRVLDNSGRGIRSVAEELAQKTDAEIIQVIGNVFIIYRENEEEPVYKLPE